MAKRLQKTIFFKQQKSPLLNLRLNIAELIANVVGNLMTTRAGIPLVPIFLVLSIFSLLNLSKSSSFHQKISSLSVTLSKNAWNVCENNVGFITKRCNSKKAHKVNEFAFLNAWVRNLS